MLIIYFNLENADLCICICNIYVCILIYTVTIESTDGEPWMGFILQARRVTYGLDQTQNVGSFVTNPSSTTQTCASYGVRICKACKLNILKRNQAYMYNTCTNARTHVCAQCTNTAHTYTHVYT